MQVKESEVQALLCLGQALAALREINSARHTLSLALGLSQERDYGDHSHRAQDLMTLVESQ